MEEEDIMRRLLTLCLFVLAALAAQAQAPLWQYNSPSAALFEPTQAGDGTVYFGTIDGKLRALTSAGLASWTINPGAVLVTPIALQNQTLYFGTADENLRAYSLAGKMKWKVRVDKNISTTLAVAGNGMIFFGIQTGDVYGVNGKSGNIAWKYHAGTQLGPPSIGHDGTVYMAADNFVLAMDPSSGAVKWRKNFFNFSNAPIALDRYDDLFYNRDGILDVYDFSGHFLWEGRDATGALLLFEKTAPVVYEDILIIAAKGGGNIYGLDVSTGSIVWDFVTANSGNPITWSASALHSMAVDATGTVTYCDDSGVIAWFDAATGYFYGYMPSIGSGGDVSLIGVDLKGRALIRSGNGSTMVTYNLGSGPNSGPWSQGSASSLHQMRRDDAPAVAIISPMDGSSISGIFAIHATATDDYSLSNLSLYLNGTLLQKDSNGEIVLSLDSATFQDGTYTITALGKDSGGNQSMSSVTVDILNPPPVYGVSSGPPVFSWLSNGIDNKYQVNISADPSFSSILASSAKQRHKWTRKTSWQPGKKKWRKVTDRAVISPTTQTTFYWRVLGKNGGLVMTKTFIIDKTH
jgi:outer membrane protein assembly factor BamB